MIRLRAPAKINLYLRVLGRRPDGYHEIETVFERIDLADELTFEPSDTGISLTCSDSTLSCGEDNLVVKATRLLQARPHTTLSRSMETNKFGVGVRIHLIKNIPIAAGLGGGSSDAAATLLGLNELWELGLTRTQLIPLAAELGSDVPFFLSTGAFAIGRGRGEACEPIDAGARLAHVLVCPNIPLSTKEVYAGLQIDLTDRAPSLSILLHALRNGSAMAGLAEGLRNDLEPEAIRRCPIITEIQSHLRQLGCVSAHMSGSGPSVFGLCQHAEQAQVIAARMRQQHPQTWHIGAVHTLHHDVGFTGGFAGIRDGSVRAGSVRPGGE